MRFMQHMQHVTLTKNTVHTRQDAELAWAFKDCARLKTALEIQVRKKRKAVLQKITMGLRFHRCLPERI